MLGLGSAINEDGEVEVMEVIFQIETLYCLYTDAPVQRIYACTNKIMKEVIWRSR